MTIKKLEATYSHSPDYPFPLPENEQKALTKLRMNKVQHFLADPNLHAYRLAYQEACQWQPSFLQTSEDVITVGKSADLNIHEQSRLLKSLESFKPWKKGPFQLFDISIDSEWRSDLKWRRFQPHFSLRGQVVCDIGCHNGYHMFRMGAEKPKAVIGLEPVGKHFFNFHLINSWVRDTSLFYEPLGVENLDLYPKCFDTIFCMGILYHHTDPVKLLRKLKTALKKGGRVFIDCQGIAGQAPVALTPDRRYAGAKGVWFLPTLNCLKNWVKRSGFEFCETIYSGKLLSEEQRRTPWAPIKSLKDFLCPENLDLTIEKHPAPWRFYLMVG